MFLSFFLNITIVDNRKREQAVEHEQNWRNLETLETRLSRTSSGGDSTTELNILRRLSASENNWRLKDIPQESANWRASLPHERPQASEWQTTEGTESWRSNNGGRHLDNTTSWRTINDISVIIRQKYLFWKTTFRSFDCTGNLVYFVTYHIKGVTIFFPLKIAFSKWCIVLIFPETLKILS